MNSYIGAFQKCLQFTGRTRRSEFWMFTLVNTIISFCLGGAVLYNMDWTTGAVGNAGISLVYSVYSLAVFLPALSMSARRLHDTGRSAWWFLIVFVPLFGFIALLVFYVLDSEPGTNKWGPNPKAAAAAANLAWGD